MPSPSDVLAVVLTAWCAGTATLTVFTRASGGVARGHFKVAWLVSAGLGAVAGFVHPPAWAAAAACLAAFAAVYRDLDLVAGVAASALAVGALVVVGPPPALATAAMLGSVTNAMLLGHWHLNQPRMGTRPIMRGVIALWLSLGAFAAVSRSVLALGFVAFAVVLTGMVTQLVRTRSIMSATGVLYLEILLTFVAAFAWALSL